MAFKIHYKSSVGKDLKRLPAKELVKVLNKIDSSLTDAPEINKALKGKFSGFRRLRVGDIRVVYGVDGDEVIIMRVADRKDVYR